MNNKEVTRKEFLAIAGGVLVFLFGGIPSKIIKSVVPQKKTVAITGNSAYGGTKKSSSNN